MNTNIFEIETMRKDEQRRRLNNYMIQSKELEARKNKTVQKGEKK